MPTHLLDTNICVMLLKQQTPVWNRLGGVGSESCAISEVTLAELLYGAQCSIRPDHNRRLVEELTASFETYSIKPVLRQYAQMKFRLRQAGNMLDEFDTLIAATAAHYGLIMVTNNTKHFNRFPELQLEDWMIR